MSEVPPVNEPRWLNQEQQQAWRALVIGSTLLFDRLDADLRDEFNISLGEYEILVRLSENNGSMRMAQLADAMAHSRSRITHTIKRMEKVGLVERCNSPEDGRGVVAKMTPQGMTTLRGIAPRHVESVRDHLVDLCSPEDFAAMGRVMHAVTDRLISNHPEMELRTPH